MSSEQAMNQGVREQAEAGRTTRAAPSQAAPATHADPPTPTAPTSGNRAAGEHGSEPSGTTPALVDPARAQEYRSRWDNLKGGFVDNPRNAVHDADGLVGQVLDELEQMFRKQRADLEHGLNNDSASTEDLRVAFGRYREFFDRLLSM